MQNDASEKKHKLTIFYDKDGEVSAFTENKTIENLFEITRNTRYYRKRKVKMNEIQYRGFIAIYNRDQMFINVLTDGELSFDFVTTYRENFELETETDRIFDTLLDQMKILTNFGFNEEVMHAIEKLYDLFMHDKPKLGKYNTFNLFLKLFYEKFL